MEKGLDILKSKAPGWYTYTKNGLDLIWQDLTNDVPGVYVDSRSFRLDWDHEPPPGRAEHYIQAATMLVHEACHVHRYEAGLQPGEYVGEKACLETNIVATQVFAPNSDVLRYDLELLAKIDDPKYQWWLPGNY